MSSKKADPKEMEEMLAFSIFSSVGYAREGMSHLEDWQTSYETRNSWRVRIPGVLDILDRHGLRIAVSSTQDLLKSLDKLQTMQPRPAYSITTEIKETPQCQSSQEKQKV
jgi:hypothetical protein